MSQELRNKLKAARLKLTTARKKMTQRQFAEMLGVSCRTLESWEADRTTPQGYALTALNQTLDKILAKK